jgi:competence CoiA-like predicted nuclease
LPTIPFAINRETGKEVHIDDATKKDKYICIACGQPLIVNDGPVLGKFFKHFRFKWFAEECLQFAHKEKYTDQHE